MKSATMRTDPLFMRNEYETMGKFGIPIVKRQEINLENANLIACSETKANDNSVNKKKGVHFFVDDYRFSGIYDHPRQSLSRYSQYAFLLTPDFSTYADMDLWRQIESVAKNRWCGAFWQSQGLLVVPTISWSGSSSYDFCFDGVEKEAVVAIGMVGCKKSHLEFMRGYNAMLERLNPATIICLGKPFAEMEGNIISFDYRGGFAGKEAC